MDWTHLNWIDYTLLAVLAVSTLISFARGFVREAISLVVWIAAIWVAYRYCRPFGDQMLTMIDTPNARVAVAFMLLLFAVLLLGAFVNFAFGHFVSKTGLSGIDRILGMVFGFARGVLLVAVAILAVQVTNASRQPVWQASQLVPEFAGITEWLKSFVPEQFDKVKEQVEHKQKKDEMTQPAVSPAPSSTTLHPEITIKLQPGAVEPATPAPVVPSTTTTDTTTNSQTYY